MVILPDAAALATPDGQAGRLGGFFVHGRRSDGALCSVHDGARAAIGLAFFVRLGRDRFDVVRTTISTTMPQTVEQMVSVNLRQFEAGDGPPPATNGGLSTCAGCWAWQYR